MQAESEPWSGELKRNDLKKDAGYWMKKVAFPHSFIQHPVSRIEP
jgi:hypothetical protein